MKTLQEPTRIAKDYGVTHKQLKRLAEDAKRLDLPPVDTINYTITHLTTPPAIISSLVATDNA